MLIIQAEPSGDDYFGARKIKLVGFDFERVREKHRNKKENFGEEKS